MAQQGTASRIDPGIAHNDVLTKYYAQRPISEKRSFTLASFEAMVKEVSTYVTGVDKADIQTTLRQAATDLPKLKVFNAGRLPGSAQEMLALLADDVISSGRLTKQVSAELQQIARMGQSPVIDIEGRLSRLSPLAAGADAMFVETFQSVGMASCDYWTAADRTAAPKLKRSSDVILCDAYGALIGLFYPAPGVASIILGAAFSVASNEAQS